MADKKISALTGAATPLAGTEVLPIVQSGATVKATIADIVGAGTSPGSFTSLTASGAATTGKLTVQRTGVPTQYIEIIAANGGAFNQIKSPGAQIGGWQFRNVADNGSSFEFTDAGAASLPGNLTLTTAAKGINFTANTPAAGMTSQLLNWYEEGTWTPNQGAGLTLVGAFSSSGTYTRIGRQVTVCGQVVGATSVAVAAAGVISSNLPFTAAVTHAGSMFNSAVNASGVVQITSASVAAATTIAATPNITFTATYTV